jgi:hypothetical protein
MEKYYTQVAKLDYMLKEFREKVSDLSDLQLQSIKFLTINLPVV